MSSRRISGLYGITPQTRDDAWLCSRVEQALCGGMGVLQYRSKDADASMRLRQSRALLALCRGHGVPLVVNDDIELALAIGADGVHLGRDDAAVEHARRTLGRAAIIGVSCYADLGRLEPAVHAGADYVAFGSFFPSRVKPDAPCPSPGILRQARARCDLPLVAIGGITPGNARVLVEHGADALAVISALFDVPDTLAAARAFAACFDRCTTAALPT